MQPQKVFKLCLNADRVYHIYPADWLGNARKKDNYVLTFANFFRIFRFANVYNVYSEYER